MEEVSNVYFLRQNRKKNKPYNVKTFRPEKNNTNKNIGNTSTSEINIIDKKINKDIINTNASKINIEYKKTKDIKINNIEINKVKIDTNTLDTNDMYNRMKYTHSNNIDTNRNINTLYTKINTSNTLLYDNITKNDIEYNHSLNNMNNVSNQEYSYNSMPVDTIYNTTDTQALHKTNNICTRYTNNSTVDLSVDNIIEVVEQYQHTEKCKPFKAALNNEYDANKTDYVIKVILNSIISKFIKGINNDDLNKDMSFLYDKLRTTARRNNCCFCFLNSINPDVLATITCNLYGIINLVKLIDADSTMNDDTYCTLFTLEKEKRTLYYSSNICENAELIDIYVNIIVSTMFAYYSDKPTIDNIKTSILIFCKRIWMKKKRKQ